MSEPLYYTGKLTITPAIPTSTIAAINNLYLQSMEKETDLPTIDPKIPAPWFEWTVTDDGTTIVPTDSDMYLDPDRTIKMFEYVQKHYLDPVHATISGHISYEDDEDGQRRPLWFKVGKSVPVQRLAIDIPTGSVDAVRELLTGIDPNIDIETL